MSSSLINSSQVWGQHILQIWLRSGFSNMHFVWGKLTVTHTHTHAPGEESTGRWRSIGVDGTLWNRVLPGEIKGTEPQVLGGHGARSWDCSIERNGILEVGLSRALS